MRSTNVVAMIMCFSTFVVMHLRRCMVDQVEHPAHPVEVPAPEFHRAGTLELLLPLTKSTLTSGIDSIARDRHAGGHDRTVYKFISLLIPLLWQVPQTESNLVQQWIQMNMVASKILLGEQIKQSSAHAAVCGTGLQDNPGSDYDSAGSYNHPSPPSSTLLFTNTSDNGISAEGVIQAPDAKKKRSFVRSSPSPRKNYSSSVEELPQERRYCSTCSTKRPLSEFTSGALLSLSVSKMLSI